MLLKNTMQLFIYIHLLKNLATKSDKCEDSQNKVQEINSIRHSIIKTVNSYFDDIEEKFTKYDIEAIKQEIHDNINDLQKNQRKLQKAEYIKYIIVTKTDFKQT